MFIVLEGLDGSGKSTQVKRLSEKLKSLNIPHLVTRQPTGSPIGQVAREFTKGGFGNLENETVALLFAADRFQHYKQEIAPALAKDEIVICDRYFYSNMAYQGVTDAAMARVIVYNQVVMAEKIPDIVFFLDTAPEECIRRISDSRDGVSIYETLPRLKAIRERYFAAFNRLKDTIHIVVIETDGLAAEDVCEKISNTVIAKMVQ